MPKPIVLLLLCFIALLSPSCRKFVEVPPPADRIIAAGVFTSDAKASEAVSAAYGSLINGGTSFINSLATLSGGLSSDELAKFNATAAEAEFADNALTPSNGTLKALWASAYQSIYYANALLEGLKGADKITPAGKAQLEGECRFLRSLHFFYLVNFFGDVPLVTATDYAINRNLPRTAAAAIYDFISSDLMQAKALLPASYVNGEKNRPNKWTAAALLARVQLYRQDWAGAEATAGEVISSGTYGLQVDPSTVFLKNSKEAIWQLSPTSGILRETQSLRPTGTSTLTPQYYLTASALAPFALSDLRRKRWVDSLTYSGTWYYYPAKYRNMTTTVTEYYTVLRLAEQYLIRAEARIRSGNLAGGVQDLNAVRLRAGLPGTTAATATDLLTAIGEEGRREFFSEMGYRWLNLKRLGTATTTLSSLKPGWQATDELYPIPGEEILFNAALTQNPGY